MIGREILTDWVVEALQELGGKGRLLDVCKTVWAKPKSELESSGDLFSPGNPTFGGQRHRCGSKRK